MVFNLYCYFLGEQWVLPDMESFTQNGFPDRVPESEEFLVFRPPLVWRMVEIKGGLNTGHRRPAASRPGDGHKQGGV